MKSIALLLLLTASVLSGFTQSKVTQTREVSSFTSVDLRLSATVYVNQGNAFSVTVTATPEWLERIYTEVDERALVIGIESKDRSNDYSKSKPDVIVNVTMPKVNGLKVSGSGTIDAGKPILTDQLVLSVSGSGIIHLNEYKAGKVQQGVYGSGMIAVEKAVAESIQQEVLGSGLIKTASIAGTLVSVSLEGSGEIKIEEVTAQKLEGSTAGSGNIKLQKGVITDLSLITAGSGGISASEVVGKNVSASVTGSGSISVGVLDALEASIAGSGSVVYKGSPSVIHKSITGSGSVRPQ